MSLRLAESYHQAHLGVFVAYNSWPLDKERSTVPLLLSYSFPGTFELCWVVKRKNKVRVDYAKLQFAAAAVQRASIWGVSHTKRRRASASNNAHCFWSVKIWCLWIRVQKWMILTNVKQGTLLGNEVRLYSKKGLIRKTVFESQLSFLG